MANKILQNIFSIKNDSQKNHKIITALGLKIKIRDFYCEVSHEKINKKIKNFSRKGVCNSERSPKLIVSLTSFPQRMNDIHYTIYSLLNQTLKPDKLILWLGEDKFPNKEKDLPEQLLKFKNNGLSIMWCKDIRSYTKIIPSLKNFPNDIIVTADDDIFYPRNWLKLLYNEYKKHPDDIICHRAHIAQLDEKGSFLPYGKWAKSVRHTGCSYQNFLTGVGGVLYPPHSLHSDVTNEERFLELCPHADDIWLYAMALHNGTKIRLAEHNLYRLTYNNYQREIGNTDDKTLIKINVFENGNDLQIKKVVDFYPDILDRVKENIINIACITDNSYVMPTSILLTSIKINKDKSKFYQIFVIGDKLTDSNKRKLEQLNDRSFNVKIIDYQNEFENYARPDFHVSTAALAKFHIMNLLPALDKVLYLDGDIIVQNNLVDLYNTDIKDKYAAVVKDMAPVVLYKPDIFERLNINHKNYFNSGVMLLNLKKMREDDLCNKLIDYKKNGINFFMDQDALNCCFHENVKYISLKNNYVITLPQRFSNKEIKKYYKEHEKTGLKNAHIIHLASPKKPWNADIPLITNLFYGYYKNSPFKNLENKVFYKYEHPFKYFLKHNTFFIENIKSGNKWHKVVYILGIKFSFRNKAKERKMAEKFEKEQIFKALDDIKQQNKTINIQNKELIANLQQQNKLNQYQYNESLIKNNVFPIGSSSVFVPDYPIDYIQKTIVQTGNFYEIRDLKYLDNFLNDNSIVLDIGANIGNHTVYWAKNTKVKKVYSFEPIKTTYEKLKKNIELNGLNNVALPFNIGVGDVISKSSIKSYDYANCGASSIVSNSSGDIDIKTIDSLMFADEKIDLIKIDTEGFEYKVLKGAIETIKKYKPAIYVEIDKENYQKVTGFLLSLNYSLKRQVKNTNYLFMYKDRV